MPIGWFLCPYQRRLAALHPTRYCAMDDFTSLIEADGGTWREAEVLGDRAMVKVRASAATLAIINGAAGFRKIPLAVLDDSLASLTEGQRTAIKNEILDAGYSLAELNAAHPDLSATTLRQILQFLTRRRLTPRYDQPTDTIVCDGPLQPCTSPDELDGAVT